ncbi:Uncharacterised protein [uncultured archaeon]|nr:Uncharacterised protein [uncultured archaeon]
MKGKLLFVLFLLSVIAVAGVQQTTSLPAYLDAYNTTFNTNTTCDVCHVNPAGGGSLNSYGKQFQAQPDHATDPASAISNIGPTTAATTPVTPTVTTMVTPTATTMVTPTPAVTPTPIATEIPTEMPTTIVETPTEVPPTTMPTATQTTPGFEQVFFIIGLLAGYVLLKQHNK